MLKIETDRQFLIFPSWLKVAYSWKEIQQIVENPIKYDKLAQLNYTKEDFERFGYSFDVPVDILDGPCGGGILVPHLPRGKAWVAQGALTFDKGADIRDLRYLESYGQEFYYKKLNVAHLEHLAHAGSLYRYDKPPKNPKLFCSMEHVDFLTDEVYWLVTGRSPASSEMLHFLPGWAKAFHIKLELLSGVSLELQDFTQNWVPEKQKTVWFKVTSKNQGMGFHFAVLIYFGFHLATTEKRRIKSMHLLADIEGKPKLFQLKNPS
jgi:hypothetical protein